MTLSLYITNFLLILILSDCHYLFNKVNPDTVMVRLHEVTSLHCRPTKTARLTGSL